MCQFYYLAKMEKKSRRIHAGWRGLLAGVIKNTTESLATPPSKIKAWIGPAISESVYSVGNDLRQSILSKKNLITELSSKKEKIKYTSI